MSTIFETKINNHLFVYQPTEQTQNGVRAPIRKRRAIQESFIPFIPNYLFELFVGRIVDPKDATGATKSQLVSNSFLQHAVGSNVTSLEKRKNKVQEILQKSTSIRIIPTVEKKEGNEEVGFKLAFQTIEGEGDSFNVVTLLEYEYYQTDETINTLNEMIDAIEQFIKCYYRWAAQAINRRETGMDRLNDNPIYDLLAFDYFLRIVAASESQMEASLITQLSLKPQTPLEVGISFLANGTTVHSQVFEAYTQGENDLTSSRTLSKINEDGTETKNELISLNLYGPHGRAFRHTINIQIRKQRQAAFDISVKLNADLKF